MHWHAVDAGYGLVANIIAPTGNYPRGVKGSPTLAYGRAVYHYVALVGYDDAYPGGAVYWADPGFQPFWAWVSLEQTASLIAGKGYAYPASNLQPQYGDDVVTPEQDRMLREIHAALFNKVPRRALRAGVRARSTSRRTSGATTTGCCTVCSLSTARCWARRTRWTSCTPRCRKATLGGAHLGPHCREVQAESDPVRIARVAAVAALTIFTGLAVQACAAPTASAECAAGWSPFGGGGFCDMNYQPDGSFDRCIHVVVDPLPFLPGNFGGTSCDRFCPAPAGTNIPAAWPGPGPNGAC